MFFTGVPTSFETGCLLSAWIPRKLQNSFCFHNGKKICFTQNHTVGGNMDIKIISILGYHCRSIQTKTSSIGFCIQWNLKKIQSYVFCVILHNNSKFGQFQLFCKVAWIKHDPLRTQTWVEQKQEIHLPVIKTTFPANFILYWCLGEKWKQGLHELQIEI